MFKLLNILNLLLLICIIIYNYYYNELNILNIIDIILSNRLLLVSDYDDRILNLYLIFILLIIQLSDIHDNIIISTLSLFLNLLRVIILIIYLYSRYQYEKYYYKLNEMEYNNNDIIECSICLEIINNKYSLTICNHIFHNKCIYQWLKIKNTCPICREILKDNY